MCRFSMWTRPDKRNRKPRTLRQRVIKNPHDAEVAWNTLITRATEYATNHQRADRAALRRALIDAGIDLQAPRSYQNDIDKLLAQSERTLATLRDFSRIHIGDQSIEIKR
jgi:hypothetical protein